MAATTGGTMPVRRMLSPEQRPLRETHSEEWVSAFNGCRRTLGYRHLAAQHGGGHVVSLSHDDGEAEAEVFAETQLQEARLAFLARRDELRARGYRPARLAAVDVVGVES